MNRTLKCLSLLLGYPSAELQQAVGEMRAALRAERALPAQAMERIEPLLERLGSADLMDLQSDYGELFDGSRSLSLHLFEHVHGESRDRGRAMIDLGQEYIRRGFAIEAAELPDFLPLFLEFLSLIEPGDAQALLAQPAHVFTALEERLAERGSPYGAIFHALLVLPRARPDAEALAALRARMKEADAETIDEQWEEAPVTFGREDPIGRPKGVVARIRMVLKR